MLAPAKGDPVRIIVVGATGTIGRPVVAALSARHEILGVSRTRAPIRGSAAICLVNAALEGFARAAALEVSANGTVIEPSAPAP